MYVHTYAPGNVRSGPPHVRPEPCGAGHGRGPGTPGRRVGTHRHRRVPKEEVGPGARPSLALEVSVDKRHRKWRLSSLDAVLFNYDFRWGLHLRCNPDKHTHTNDKIKGDFCVKDGWKCFLKKGGAPVEYTRL